MKRLVLNLLRARMMKGMSTKKAVTEEDAIRYVFQFARVLCFAYLRLVYDSQLF